MEGTSRFNDLTIQDKKELVKGELLGEYECGGKGSVAT